MKPFFTEVIKLENSVSAFGKLGFDLGTLKHVPEEAIKIVIQQQKMINGSILS